MIHLTDRIWIGDATAWRNAKLFNIGAVLNVAQDLRCDCGWPDVEYAQVGLVDGPGNLLCMYRAAALALMSLVERHNTLVCCHGGSRSMAVVLMYLGMVSGRKWDDLLDLLRERADIDLPIPHPAHKEAFDKIDWRLLMSTMENE